MKRLFLASLTMLSLMATAGCSPALAQCVGNACGLASAVYTAHSGSQSCSYMECSPGHGRHSRRGCRQSCQVVQSYQSGSCQAGQCGVVTQAPMPTSASATTVAPTPASSSFATTSTGSDDALAEVNARRSSRGLRPFVHDPLLTKAAAACAKVRAASHIHGHLQSDFAYLPSGANAAAAGCGALEPSWGWGTCCMDDNYTYAGAAWVMGSDGLRYMHLFVR